MAEATTLDVIRYSAQGKPVEVKKAVDTLMIDKVRDAIAGIRAKTGQEIFNKKPDEESKDENVRPTT